ncbi:cation diffusion facilitator family transporter [Bacteriovorax sp. BSW11_IV]|uniref:cation diffusion facilitator family transporter n=1 Tax=Bacteriovorax sp. BSW11_IV TaxID=1353529 RepID=UPI000389F7C8|nr:cation diffusion facilitator family transporter [Bacteriovorax sp. BSW11_IV]EQC47800.1 cation diffusion facilitator family transporter [Bacteriovorax sp. BSW11_IV]
MTLSERRKGISRVLWITFYLNIAVALIKIVVGHMFAYLSLTSSGLESMVDSSTNILALITIYYASKPADSDHNYGHHKAETLGSMVVAFLLLFSAYQVAGEINIKSILEGDFSSRAQFGPWPVISIIVSMMISLFVSTYERKWGERYNSSLLIADASHTFGDFIISGAVLISIIASYFGHFWLDTVVGLVVICYLVYLALKIVRINLNDLLDGAPPLDEGFLKEIEKFDHVKDIHNFRIRGNEHWLHADFHVHLDPNLTLVEAHAVGQQVENAVVVELKKIAGHVDVLIHIEPWEEKDGE